MISPILFLIVIDWVMKKSTEGRPRGITWKAFSQLEDEDFADDIALLSHSHRDMQEKTAQIETIARSVGLKINHNKSKIMKVSANPTTEILVNDMALENVEEFNYLGSYLNADGDINREISSRIANASLAFQRLKNIWSSGQINETTKIKLYKSNVRSVLLYAAETWKTNQRIESRLRGFEGRCLRRILGIRWEHKVTNERIAVRTGVNSIVEEAKIRRWRWLGHILRMRRNRHPVIALNWNPQGKRSRGRPRGTWRRTVDTEGSKANKTWHELKWLAQDRNGWRDYVVALCAQRDDENR